MWIRHLLPLLILLSSSLVAKSIRLQEGLDLFKSNKRVSTTGSEAGPVVECLGAKGQPTYLSLDVKDAHFKNGKQPKVKLSFEVLDNSHQELTVSIDSSDPLYGPLNTPGQWKGVGGIQLQGTGKWLKKEIFIEDALFKNRLNGADIRFRILNQAVFKVRKLELSDEVVQEEHHHKQLKAGTPNVLMVVFDDLNDYLGAYGNPNAKTPNLDRFAKQAMTFQRAYCQYPVCGPSRASFLSGMYPEKNGIIDNSSHLRTKQPMKKNMLEHFKDQGYWVASVGKIFHGMTNVAEAGLSTHRSDKFDNGVNITMNILKDRFKAEVGDTKKNAQAWNQFRKKNQRFGEGIVAVKGTKLEDSQHMDGRARKRICDYLTNPNINNKPFFLACGIVKPHVPFYAPQKYFDMYPLDELKFENVPQNDWSNKPKLAYNARHKGFGVAFEKQDPTKRAEWLQAYLACISFADAQFGMILDALEESGQADNTIVVMHSDHGFHIGEHFLYGKVTLFEESTRVPLMIRTPNMKKPGHRSSSLVELIDIFPTLTDLCGMPSPDHLQGKSLRPILDEPDASIRDTAYTVVTRGPKVIGKCLHHEQWRYTDWDGKQQAELYNLEKDPNEYNNLIDKPEFAQVVKVMQEKLVDRHL